MLAQAALIPYYLYLKLLAKVTEKTVLKGFIEQNLELEPRPEELAGLIEEYWTAAMQAQEPWTEEQLGLLSYYIPLALHYRRKGGAWQEDQLPVPMNNFASLQQQHREDILLNMRTAIQRVKAAVDMRYFTIVPQQGRYTHTQLQCMVCHETMELKMFSESQPLQHHIKCEARNVAGITFTDCEQVVAAAAAAAVAAVAKEAATVAKEAAAVAAAVKTAAAAAAEAKLQVEAPLWQMSCHCLRLRPI